MLKGSKHLSFASVEDYLHMQEEPARNTLQKMRATIKALVPAAEEVISYQIPTFKYNGPVAAFAAFKNHCSFFTMSHAVMKTFKEELKPYKTSGVTIHFPLDKPLPAALIKKLVTAKMKENAERLAAKNKKLPAKKMAKPKPTDGQLVDDYMNKLKHPLKDEINVVRAIIKSAHKNIAERIKWNAPSYYYQPAQAENNGKVTIQDMVTFNHRATNHVHLVFHHPAIVTISSPLLEGDYTNRRMVYFTNMAAIRKHKKALVNIMNELIKIIENNHH